MDFKGYFRKKAIALKRNFYTVPFILNVIALVIFTCSLFVHSQVAQRVTYPETNALIKNLNGLNAFFLFCITLSSILSVVAYIKYMGRIKNYFMLGVYYLFSVIQIVLEAIFLMGINNQLAFEKASERTEIVQKYISLETNSVFLIILHFIFLGIALVVSSFAPLIQAKLKKVKFAKINDGEAIEMEKIDVAEE